MDQPPQQPQQQAQAPTIDYKLVEPPLALMVTIFELKQFALQPGQAPEWVWMATVAHIFQGGSAEEIGTIIEDHKRVDALFRAAFEPGGKFEQRYVKLGPPEEV